MDILQTIGANGGAMAVIIALVALFKPFIKDKRYYPIMSVGIGVMLLTTLTLFSGGDIIQGVLTGLVMGLSAAGLYDQKNIFNG